MYETQKVKSKTAVQRAAKIKGNGKTLPIPSERQVKVLEKCFTFLLLLKTMYNGLAVTPANLNIFV